MEKLYRLNRVIIGGPMGAAAWGMSGLCVAAVAAWGLEAAAVPVLIIKGASWSLWGVGVLRESTTKKRRID
ncbi:hypothetical protein [Methylogaea oryzae]|nr:hypothetical protein [Methylogaea oryzae]